MRALLVLVAAARQSKAQACVGELAVQALGRVHYSFSMPSLWLESARQSGGYVA